MSAPTVAALAVLKGLAVGLQLECEAGIWRFVGPIQEPSHSQVDTVIIDEILDRGFARRLSGETLELTPTGDQAIRDQIVAERRDIFECLNLIPGITCR